MTTRTSALPGYEDLANVLDEALIQAQAGKGAERHARPAQSFIDQLIVVLSMELGSNHGDIFQACKKALESVRLEGDAADAELLGAINYLAAAVIVRRKLAALAKPPAPPRPVPGDSESVRLASDAAHVGRILRSFEWFAMAIGADDRITIWVKPDTSPSQARAAAGNRYGNAWESTIPFAIEWKTLTGCHQ